MMAMNKRGVFWVVDGELVAFPFDETATQGIAKSGKTYNHKLLWKYILKTAPDEEELLKYLENESSI